MKIDEKHRNYPSYKIKKLLIEHIELDMKNNNINDYILLDEYQTVDLELMTDKYFIGYEIKSFSDSLDRLKYQLPNGIISHNKFYLVIDELLYKDFIEQYKNFEFFMGDSILLYMGLYIITKNNEIKVVNSDMDKGINNFKIRGDLWSNELRDLLLEKDFIRKKDIYNKELYNMIFDYKIKNCYDKIKIIYDIIKKRNDKFWLKKFDRVKEIKMLRIK